jgi:excisionase family DNA binding protein
MAGSALLSVREAADELGVGSVAVRQRIASGRLPAIKRGRDWWLDERVVKRLAREQAGRGRPLAPSMVWAVLLLASGDEDAADRMAVQPRYRSRARAWLRDHPLGKNAAPLRDRARSEEFDAHPSELPRILGRPDVLPTGASAGGVLGLVGGASEVDVYAPVSERDAIVAEHALSAGQGPVRIRWVPDEVWSRLPDNGGRAPRAAVLVDMLESDDPRSRREAARALHL